MNIDMAGIVGDSIVDGPGIRTVFFSQGCPHHCEGCQNPETWAFGVGTPMDTETLAGIAKENPLCRGVTFSGGEPFAQAAGFAELAEALKKDGYEIASFTGYTFEQLDRMLNKESGFQGLAGAQGGDSRDVVAKAEKGDIDAVEALEAFGHRAALYIGGYNTLVGGADAIVMAGGIGENAAELREQIVKRLGALGVKLDKKANLKVRFGASGVISTKDSKIPVVVIPTNEELMIARETVAVLNG